MAGSDSRTAAQEAVERRDWTTAYEHLQSVEAPGAADLELLAEVATWSGHGADRIDLLERAADAYLRLDDPVSAARIALKLCRAHWERGDLAVAGGCLGQAGSLLADLPESPEHAFFMWNLARAALNQGDIDALIERATKAAEIAQRTHNRDVEALATLDLGHALLASGRFDEGLALMDEANALAASGTLDLQTTGTIYCSTIWSCRNLGDWRRASAWTDVSLRWCERQKVNGFPGQCRFHRAEVLRMRGALDDAERDARAAVAELAAERPIFAGWGHMELGEIARRRGDWPAAEQAFRRACELGTDPQPGFALLRLATGDVAEARAMADRALAARDVVSREERVILLPAAVTIALASGDEPKAVKHVEELRGLAERIGTAHARAAAAGAEGELALAQGRVDDAIVALRNAWEAWCEVEAPYESAAVRRLLGRAHRAAGDEAAARIELAGALTTFERLGAAADADEVRSLLLDGAFPASKRVRRTFAFVDMVGSTPLVELLGDDAWADLLAWYERTLRDIFERHDGTVVQQEGDGFFVTFPSAPAAIECALEVQRSLADHRRHHGFAPRVRIGLHSAEAHEREGDYAGLGVHAAARIGASASADEIVVSRDSLAGHESRWPVSDFRPVDLKGLSEPVVVATVGWR